MMARRRGRRSRGGFKIPILTLAAVGIPIWESFKEHQRGGDGLAHFVGSYVPFNLSTGQFETSGLVRGLLPLAAVGLTKKFLFPLIGRPRLGKFLPVSLS